jgi:hypothetical protein
MSEHLQKFDSKQLPKFAGGARKQEVLERGATFEEPPEISGSGRTAVCYNRACSDYRRERPAEEPCSCKRTSVQSGREKSR